MANAEMQLISRIIHTGGLAEAVDWGISEFDFRTTEARAIWRYAIGYYGNPSTAGSVIGPQHLSVNFPQFPLQDDPKMTTAALCFEVRRGRVIAEAKECVLAMNENVDLDPVAAIGLMQAELQKLVALGDGKSRDITFAESLSRIKTRYQAKKENAHAFAKMLWPWDLLNDHTGGIGEEDFIILFGRPKSFKTWILNIILASAFQQEKTVLVYTKEMTPDNINQRIAACIAQLPYQELRSGKLLQEDELMLDALVNHAQMKHSRANIICLNARDVEVGGDTVQWIQSKVEKYKPDAVFIDGMYLLSDPRSSKKSADWQRVMNISRDIRGMVLHTKTPVIATMQATRGASKHSDGNLDEIAYSDAVAQDTTMAMRIINEKATSTVACVLAGSREFKLHGFRINGIPATDFSFHSEMTESDIKEAEKSDADTGEVKKAARKPRTRAEGVMAQIASEHSKLIEDQLRSL